MRRTTFKRAVAEDAWILYADIGYGCIPQDYYKSRNVGIAESTMIGMAAGLASKGHKVYTYCIGPHNLRAFEFIRNLVAGTKRDITIIAAGEGDDYKMLGKPHMITSKEMSDLCAAIGLPYYFPDGMASLLDALESPTPKMLHLRKVNL